MRSFRSIVGLFTVGVCAALAGAARGEITYRVAAQSGGLAPALATGEYAGRFAAFADLPGDAGPVINNAGHVAFSARLMLASDPAPIGQIGVDPLAANPDVALAVALQNDRGIWSEGGGSLRLVAREGMPAPGTASYFGNQLREPVLNDLGQVAFQSNLLGATTDNSIWIAGGNLLVPIARTGDDPPPLTDDNDEFLSFDDPLLNNAGHTAFRAIIQGDGVVPVQGVNDRGIWTKTAADLTLIPRAGELAPGVPLASNTLFTEFSPPVLNDAGEIAFRATLSGDDVNADNRNGIWAQRLGVGLRLVAREGAIAPGTNQPFAQMGLPAFNVLGRTAFAARLLGGGSGIWKEGLGGLQLVARNGDTIRDNGQTLAFAGFSQPLLTNLNRVAFSATLAGPSVVAGTNDEAIFIERRAGLMMVARTGDLAPDAGDDVVFSACDAVNHAGDLFRPVVNERGQVAFLSCLAGPGITDANDLGLFAVTPDRELVKIAQTGDTLETSPGNLQTITDIRLKTGSGGADGRGRAFNVRGDLAFWVGLQSAVPSTTGDGEAIIVASTSTSFPLPGDANGDGWVDGYDIALLIQWWSSDEFWEGDFDYDGSITVKDLAVLQNNYGGFGPNRSPEAVPEPAAWLYVLASLPALALAGHRRSRRARRQVR